MRMKSCKETGTLAYAASHVHEQKRKCCTTFTEMLYHPVIMLAWPRTFDEHCMCVTKLFAWNRAHKPQRETRVLHKFDEHNP